MNQKQYEQIIACINHGAPALADELIGAFVNSTKMANAYVQLMEQQEKAQQQKLENKKARARMKTDEKRNLGLRGK